MESAVTKTIGIVVNGRPERVPAGLNVASLLAYLRIEAPRVAVELNHQIVHRESWEAAAIEEDARVEVVWFVGGGSQGGSQPPSR